MASQNRLDVIARGATRYENQRSWDIEWMDPFKGPSRRRGKLHVKKEVSSVLVIHKWKDADAAKVAASVAAYVVGCGAKVYSETNLHPDTSIISTSNPPDVELMISIGGDGTLLHAARLYSRGDHPIIPPCVIFAMGSLGFLGNFKASRWPDVLAHVLSLSEPKFITVRSRLQCNINNGSDSIHVLNECVVVSRWEGKLGKFLLRIDGEPVTTIEGDGLVMSTATGSTGYNMSLGGPIVSPSVPCLVITPIAPSSLSFRPIIVSESSRIELTCLTASAEVIADGRLLKTITNNDMVSVATSPSPMIVVNSKPLDHDWYEGINSKLKWNARGATQK
eukprot:TRINITY_DN25143_c0_g1_i1.p1 TRINITY_DN25143_c0_g1~~TRINITY_DN25143_c0_g1_i1.p1  ORF type:complete len:381 (+),score=55.12 TRINITY_DN25143_c0_g1_i1:141-1145(+)